MNTVNLSTYAELAVRVGVNLRRGQTLVISCPVECAYFAREITTKAYSAGAREVIVRWTDDEINRLRYLYADDEVFDSFPRWLEYLFNDYAAIDAAVISVAASDPQALHDADPDRIRRYNRATETTLKDFYKKMVTNEFRWCVVSVPTEAWAKSVFPESSEEESVDLLWDAISNAVGIKSTAEETLSAWNEKISRLNIAANRLTTLGIEKLVYKNALGTDLEVGLAFNHCWSAAGEEAKDGVEFVANIPSEEIFTLPDRNRVNGTVYASLPLALSGNIIRGIKLTFKDGKIIDAYADEGLEYLQAKLDTDEGARYLGEVALVPYSSPISQLGILFLNTLFDENASCHLAFGEGIPTFTDEDKITREEMLSRGLNESLTHVDFMIGTPDLSITGITKTGEEIPIFVNGDFAESLFDER